MKSKKKKLSSSIFQSNSSLTHITPKSKIERVRVSIRVRPLNEDEKIGAKILADSFESPIRKILDNAGIDASLVVGKLLEMNDKGYDVIAKAYTNMQEAGIIDPTEAVVNEIQNAASVGGLLLTTDCLITEAPEDKNHQNIGVNPQQMMM